MPIDLDPRITLRDFVPVFMDRCRARGTRERTLARYRAALDHFVDAMGDLEVRESDRPRVETVLTQKILEVGSRQGQKGAERVARRKLQRSTVGVLFGSCRTSWPRRSPSNSCR